MRTSDVDMRAMGIAAFARIAKEVAKAAITADLSHEPRKWPNKIQTETIRIIAGILSQRFANLTAIAPWLESALRAAKPRK